MCHAVIRKHKTAAPRNYGIFGRKRSKFSAFLGKAQHQSEKKGKREKEENKKLFGSLAFLQGAVAAAAAAAAAP